jgi:hypothetical protein
MEVRARIKDGNFTNYHLHNFRENQHINMEKLIEMYITMMTSKWGIYFAFYILPPLAIWKVYDLLF